MKLKIALLVVGLLATFELYIIGLAFLAAYAASH